MQVLCWEAGDAGFVLECGSDPIQVGQLALGLEQCRVGPVSEHFLFRDWTTQSIFARYLAYNITILQTTD